MNGYQILLLVAMAALVTVNAPQPSEAGTIEEELDLLETKVIDLQQQVDKTAASLSPIGMRIDEGVGDEGQGSELIYKLKRIKNKVDDYSYRGRLLKQQLNYVNSRIENSDLSPGDRERLQRKAHGILSTLERIDEKIRQIEVSGEKYTRRVTAYEQQDCLYGRTDQIAYSLLNLTNYPTGLYYPYENPAYRAYNPYGYHLPGQAYNPVVVRQESLSGEKSAYVYNLSA